MILMMMTTPHGCCRLAGYFWPRNLVKRGICYERVCPSVCYTYESRLNGSIIYIPYDTGMSIFLRPNFAILDVGIHPQPVRYNRHPPVDGENWTNHPSYLGNEI